MSRPSFIVVLPARFGSTRFPGKPLARVAGRPLIEWVWRRASEIERALDVVVATDDERIAEAVREFGGSVVMTRADHATGTDRVAEVAASRDCEVVVNLQGDEPVFDPGLVGKLVDLLGKDPRLHIATACHAIDDAESFVSPHVVKVAVGADGGALYFSRAPIPSGAHTQSGADDGGAVRMRHVGVYAYRRDALLRLAKMPPSRLEQSEKLEQLRALENGMRIGVVVAERATMGVDTPDDVKSVEKVLGGDYTG